MKRTLYIWTLLLFLLALVLLGKVEFLVYNREVVFFTIDNLKKALWQGLPMDLSVIATIVFPVWIYGLFTFSHPRMRVRRYVGFYLWPVVFCMGVITCANIIMYENWKFPLDASVFSYMSSPGNAGASASVGYIVSRLGSALLASVIAATLATWFTPYRMVPSNVRTKDIPPKYTMVYLQTGVLMAWMVWGVKGTRASESNAFHSDKILLNHSAINPVGHMVASMWRYSMPYEKQFNYTPEDEAEHCVELLYPEDTDDLTDTLLSTDHPNVLTIQLESFGARFISPEVTPNIIRWMDKGVYFDNAWSGSFRTDRGTVCALSGMLSYPTASLMLDDDAFPKLHSLAHTLHNYGYNTQYIYGSNAQHMNKAKYLLATGFEKVLDIDDLDVPDKDKTNWGSSDGMTFDRTLQHMQRLYDQGQGQKPFYFGMQTIDSHEPFVVPYKRLDDKVLNAFAYTDECLGHFLDQLSKTPMWNNLVVVIFADHGHMYGITEDNPEFFRMPLLITGGAVKSPLRIHTIISQSDIVGTLLAQMHIPHSKDFPWSRNIFSKNYKYPSAFCTLPNEAMFVDSTGTTIMDLYSNIPVYKGDKNRTNNIRALLQNSYRSLSNL